MSAWQDDVRTISDNRVVVTAWPAKRSAEQTLFRCRVWHRSPEWLGSQDSLPYYAWGEHLLLSEGAGRIVAVLAEGSEAAAEILTSAVRGGATIEVNQEVLPATEVLDALRLPEPPPGRLGGAPAGDRVS